MTRRTGYGLLGLAAIARVRRIVWFGRPNEVGTTWFEAGLRSIRFLDLDGRCRRSAA